MPYARDHAQAGTKFYKVSSHVIDISQALKAAPSGEVLSNCWCERQVVTVPSDWPIQGKTHSCGHVNCHE